MRKLASLMTVALMALALTSATVFAGKGDPNGGQGNENKKDLRGCTKDYTLIQDEGNPYDLNGDTWVCWKSTNGGDSYVDNISH